jgi:hypothetical protein
MRFLAFSLDTAGVLLYTEPITRAIKLKGENNMFDDYTSNEDQTIDAEAFMNILDISPNTFTKLLRNGMLPTPLPLGNRIRRWSRQVVMNFLNTTNNLNTNPNTQI